MRIDVRIPSEAAASRGTAYPIEIVPGPPGEPSAAIAGEVLAPGPRRLLVVTDDNVAPLHLAELEGALRGAGHRVKSVVLPAGETQKTLATVEHVLDSAFAHKLSRRDAFVALGGGVVGDITGFCAAIYLRGVDVVQVPTTLLAQVDSSVGGKTGVNHVSGKNLIGAFWQPRAVVASHSVLTTLPPREVRCGLAEALKHALIADPTLLAALVGPDLGALDTSAIVAACCRIKSAIVAEDPCEDPVAGRRAVLNFGHTFGHAYEKLLGYGRWTHGEAVAVGMVWAARLSERLGVAAPGLEAELVRALARLDLPADPDDATLPALAALIEAARGDKKGDHEGVRFVLLERVGLPLVRRLSWLEIARALDGVGADGRSARA